MRISADGLPGERMYSRGETYNMDNLAAAQSDYVTRWSINNNPVSQLTFDAILHALKRCH